MQDCPKYHYLKREGSTTQGKLYNYEKEYLLFQTVYEQVKFVREKRNMGIKLLIVYMNGEFI